MLAYTLLFFVTLLASVLAIWLWRIVSRWDGIKGNIIENRVTTARTKLKTPQGFTFLSRSDRERAKYKTLRNSKGNIKAPWGW
jgi:hypothetical protein